MNSSFPFLKEKASLGDIFSWAKHTAETLTLSPGHFPCPQRDAEHTRAHRTPAAPDTLSWIHSAHPSQIQTAGLHFGWVQ